MNKKLRKIINHYGIDKQLKYFQSEVFELNEAIIKRRNTGIIESITIGITNAVAPLLNTKNVDYSKEHIKEEIADVMVMLKQMQLYYNISDADVKEVMKFKVDRQIERINEEVSKNDEWCY